MDLTTSEEKHTIHVFLKKSLSRLNEADQNLPQIALLRDLLCRGLGVHHAGLLPIMKEVVEMLVCEGIVKVLFCTETFAMGVNAPTRTVVFDSIHKYDGKSYRYLLPGEYTQMAGRAGRRGLDAVGNVVVAAWDNIPGESDLRNILTGRGVSIESQFRLTYSMILNLLNNEVKVEDVMKCSFSEWRTQRAAPAAAQQLQAVEEGLLRLARTLWPPTNLGCTREDILEYFELNEQVHALTRELQASIMTSKAAQTALIPGRTLIYSNPVNGLPELAVLLGDTPASCLTPQASSAAGAGATSALFRGIGSGPGAAKGERRLALLVLHRPGGVDDQHLKTVQQLAATAPQKGPKPPVTSLPDEFAGMVAIPKGGARDSFGDMRSAKRGDGPGARKVEAGDILNGEWGPGPEAKPDARAEAALVAALRALQKIKDQSPGGLPLLDPRADLKVSDLNLASALTERNSLITLRSQTLAAADPSISEAYALIREERALLAQRCELEHKLSDAGLQALPDFRKRVAVLQHMGYLDPQQKVLLRGRVACEISSTQDELLATELVFSGILGGLNPAEAVALISALVFEEGSDAEPELPENLSNAWKRLTEIALNMANVQVEKGLSVDPSQYVREKLHPGIMQVVYEWAQGKAFAEICSLTNVMEGSIVRAIVRLDQACRELQVS
ncbi:NUC185 domain-containing protein [Dunaliella salina]|uniref:NUC185 domain-containing protein n=1 Tax=Dunaliella salina TaxID=3046 RepID=A0ABQ7H3L8_DUNSA|nr:NUC185 domain-containing protein [Dunaliella salina]|eukprot:KAF5841458.1 NUC185 domain-containing protein [Dunaliella salina]